MSQLRQLVEPVIAQKDHIRGSIESPVVILAYGDFECPDSGYFFWVIKKLQKKLKDKISYVFRNFPLEEIHPHALMAAVAAEAAGAQNKFWEMHDLLFVNQGYLKDEDFLKYAEKLKLNMELFKRDYFNRVYWGRIRKDVESGLVSGVDQTPTLFINGIMYEESYDYKTLLKVIKSVVGNR